MNIYDYVENTSRRHKLVRGSIWQRLAMWVKRKLIRQRTVAFDFETEHFRSPSTGRWSGLTPNASNGPQSEERAAPFAIRDLTPEEQAFMQERNKRYSRAVERAVSQGRDQVCDFCRRPSSSTVLRGSGVSRCDECHRLLDVTKFI